MIASLLFCAVYSQSTRTFTNPILPSGADPFSFYKDGYYYYTHTLGNRIGLWKTKSIADLSNATHKTVYTPPPGTMWSKSLWAPEIHFINGRWYIYYAADNGVNENHRMYVLENKNADPMQGGWEWKGKIADSSDKWAIDGNVFEYKKQLYMVWSGWEGDVNGQQNIYIARMKDPLSISGERVCISRPFYDWETHGRLTDANNPPQVNVNKGPQALMHGDKLHIVFSASGCWTDHYSLGLLTFNGKEDLLDSTAWKKKPAPIFTQSPGNAVFAPGHNSFFKSPDGKQDWILYHANDQPGQGCGRHRSPRAQPFSWNEAGEPVLGEPVKTGVALAIPAGN